jgi:N-acetylmuramoyl-L-alanine amidase
MIVLFDNGHGIDTPGKRSPDAAKGWKYSPLYFREYAWTREVAHGCCDVLQALGFDARILVPEENDIPLAERCRRANDICARAGRKNVLLVSIHNNAAGSGDRWLTARGWGIYTTKGITEADVLADYIVTEAKKEFKAPLKLRLGMDRYLERDREENFYILAKSQCPAVLIENFFQDNKDDVRYLKSDSGKGSCIHVITQGVENYIKSKA